MGLSVLFVFAFKVGGNKFIGRPLSAALFFVRRAGHTRRENGADSAKGAVFVARLASVPFGQGPICAGEQVGKGTFAALAKAPIRFAFVRVDSVAKFNQGGAQVDCAAVAPENPAVHNL